MFPITFLKKRSSIRQIWHELCFYFYSFNCNLDLAMFKVLMFVNTSLCAGLAFAGYSGPVATVPVPGSLGLLAAGVVGALVVYLRKNRK
jgi:hypothetical protein